MARSEPSTYGTDVACFDDADGLFSAVTGIGSVIQDAYHRITTDNILGPGGIGWGYDVRRLLGARASDAIAAQSTIASVLLRDERIATANVTIAVTGSGPLVDAAITVACTTALGPFRFVLNIADISTLTIEQQAPS